ncbi:MAG: dihydropteroate synthase [Actinobacteria bacterium]|nr:dihydropteroate synthase [Actinomycetota bacterium]MBL7123682.1 dihydropteroate synthase [Actinomycetota bacterium]
METVVTGKRTEVKFGLNLPTVIIAERINPTGRKSLAEELKQGKFDIVREDAIKQTEAGAHIIDINVGAVGVDEVEMLPKAVKMVMEVTNQPLCLDSANPKALKAALEVYPCKALINSVNGEERSLEEILPMVKESGSAVICLTMDEGGIPDNVEKRFEIAEKIIKRAESIGIKKEDLVFDCLVIPNSTNSDAGRITLETQRRVAKEFGVSITGGYSNVSFGMPDRNLLNIHFITMGIISGLCAPITDPLIDDLMEAIKAADFLAGRDSYGMNYISFYRK